MNHEREGGFIVATETNCGDLVGEVVVELDGIVPNVGLVSIVILSLSGGRRGGKGKVFGWVCGQSKRQDKEKV